MYTYSKVLPYDSFVPVYNVLVWAGYHKPLEKLCRKKEILHNVYRVVIIVFIVVYTLQHLIYIVQLLQFHHNIPRVIDSVILFIPHVNLIVKVTTMYYKAPKMAEIDEVLKDSEFCPTTEQDEAIMEKNKRLISRLCLVTNISFSIGGVLWILACLVKRYREVTGGVIIYVPYATDTWPKFLMLLLNQNSTYFWIGIAHIYSDILIATYYAQAQTQIEIMKNHLENLVPRVNINYDTDDYLTKHFIYKDISDKKIKKRFIAVVKRYDKVVWYINEIALTFNIPLMVQFITSSGIGCIVIYSITKKDLLGVTILFLLFMISALLMQVFLYCYFGNLVEFESRSINTSLYLSDWLCLSPSFRRILLIAMCRWGHPLRPKVGFVIPLSLDTFVQIVKASYSLYTLL